MSELICSNIYISYIDGMNQSLEVSQNLLNHEDNLELVIEVLRDIGMSADAGLKAVALRGCRIHSLSVFTACDLLLRILCRSAQPAVAPSNSRTSAGTASRLPRDSHSLLTAS